MKRYCAVLLACLAGACAPSRKVPESSAPPVRIVSLAPAITQKLYLLGVDDRLVANTIYCNTPEDAKGKAKIGNVTQVDVELIVSHRPDLVIASNLTRPEQVEKLTNLGIRVVRRPNPETFDELCESFVELGKIVGEEEKAAVIAAKARADVDALRKLVSELPRKSVFVQLGAKPLFAATQDSFVNDYIEFAGGSNIVAQGAEGIYSREKVVMQDPEVIIVTTMGLVGVEEKKEWDKYTTITAVKNDAVYVIDSYRICSPTPTIFVEALRDVIKILHPELELE